MTNIRTIFTILLLIGFIASSYAQDVSIPDPGLNAAIREALQRPDGPLTEGDLLTLTNLDASRRSVRSITGLEAARNLLSLDLRINSLTDFSLPPELTSLSSLYLSLNQLTNCWIPSGLTNLSELILNSNHLSRLELPGDLSFLTELNLDHNRLEGLTLPTNLTHLSFLHLRANLLTNFNLPADLSALIYLDLSTNRLTNVSLPAGLRQLSILALSGNDLVRFALPPGFTNLISLFLAGNQLTNVTLPSDLGRLRSLDLAENQLSSFTVPGGMSNLFGLFLAANRLTNITLPQDMASLGALGYSDNPLMTLVLSEPLAATNLLDELRVIRNQGVSVFTYPLAIQLNSPRRTQGAAFDFSLTGPPGLYLILNSTNLVTGNLVASVTNSLGSVNFSDEQAGSSEKNFYRALLLSPPRNMVFIPPNTFTMGSPTNEQDRSIFEGPQAIVTLTRGFWMGKNEVTQGEYLAVMGENPSNFPGDLNRPVSSVTWFDATNYCRKLTQRELETGRIPPGSRYRLPTEAEWECAARAGTTTRFSYGDDPNYASLTNYAWFLDEAILDLTVHPVGQKLPNPWGIYDMHGHLWEWCQDWYDDQLGGIQTDPTGPPGPVQLGRKVMRGGAYDYSRGDCRSASRFFHPAIFPDSDLGFRVVLVTEP